VGSAGLEPATSCL